MILRSQIDETKPTLSLSSLLLFLHTSFAHTAGASSRIMSVAWKLKLCGGAWALIERAGI